MTCTTYKQSQELIAGQAQYKNELPLLRQKCPKNLTPTQYSHARKFNNYMAYNKLTLEQGGTILGITPGQCLDVCINTLPITQDMEDNFLRNVGIQLSQLRLDPTSEAVKQARKQRFLDIAKYFAFAVEPIKKKKTLLDFRLNEEQIKINSINACALPCLGVLIKMARAGAGLTQYTIAAQMELQGITGRYGDRGWVRDAEHNDRVTQEGNIYFYKTYGITIEQFIAPYKAWAEANNIPLLKLKRELKNRKVNNSDELFEIIDSNC